MERRLLPTTVLLALLAASLATASELKPIKTHRVKDLTVTVLNDTGQWKVGKNTFVLEFISADRKPVEVSKATLSTSMPMPGMAPMLSGATLEPDGPGRYRGSISFPDAGTRQVTISWDGADGRNSTRFSVPVR